MRARTSLLVHAGTLLLALTVSTPGLAQLSTDTTRYSVIVNQVKPEMLNEWLDIQRNEINPLIKKGGITQRTVLANVLGNTYEYASISPLESYAMYDPDSPISRVLASPEGARVLAKLRKCVTSSRTYTIARVNDISSPPDPKNPPLVSISTRIRIANGKALEYENLIKNEMAPIYRKAKAEGKIAGYIFSRRQLGANVNERTSTVYLNKFADVEGGPTLTRLLGAEAAAKLTLKLSGLSTTVETLLRRRVADLSF